MNTGNFRYRDMDEWLDEIEVFGTRRERLLAEFDHSVIPWLKVAWALGEIQSELTSDGHAAEAMKDVHNAGWPEAAEVIENVTLPESRRIIRHNVTEIAKAADLRPHHIKGEQ